MVCSETDREGQGIAEVGQVRGMLEWYLELIRFSLDRIRRSGCSFGTLVFDGVEEAPEVAPSIFDDAFGRRASCV